MKGRCANDNGELEKIGETNPEWDKDNTYDVYRCKFCGHVQFFLKK